MSLRCALELDISCVTVTHLLLEATRTHTHTSDPWIEFHVDNINMKLIGDNVGPFGGNASVRCPAGSRPLIIFGQDESIFNQFSHSGCQWLGPLGQRSIMPKSAGMGIMLSAL